MNPEKEPNPPITLMPSQIATFRKLTSVYSELHKGQTAVLLGLPGTGKTTILEELKKQGIHTAEYNERYQPSSDQKTILGVTDATLPKELTGNIRRVIWHSGFSVGELKRLLPKKVVYQLESSKINDELLETYSMGSTFVLQSLAERLKSCSDYVLAISHTLSSVLYPFVEHEIENSLTIPSKTIAETFLRSVFRQKLSLIYSKDITQSIFNKIVQMIGNQETEKSIYHYVASFYQSVIKGEIQFGNQQLQTPSATSLEILKSFAISEPKPKAKRRLEPRLSAFAGVPKIHTYQLVENAGGVIFEGMRHYTRKTGLVIGNWDKGLSQRCSNRLASFEIAADNWLGRTLEDKMIKGIKKPFISRGIGGKDIEVFAYIGGDHYGIHPANLGGLAGFITLCENFGYNCYIDLDSYHGGKGFFYDASQNTYTPLVIPLL